MQSIAQQRHQIAIHDAWQAVAGPGITPAQAILEVANECECTVNDTLDALRSNHEQQLAVAA